MKRMVMVAATLAVALMPTTAAAELRRVEIAVLGMD